MKDSNTVSVGNCETCGYFPTQFIEEDGVTKSKALESGREKRERHRREELEVVAAALYLDHDDAKEQMEMYKAVYLDTSEPNHSPCSCPYEITPEREIDMKGIQFQKHTQRYEKGRDYFNCCRIPAHETLIGFTNDTDSEAFEAWFRTEGFPLFEEFLATFTPTHRKQLSVIREEMRG